MKVVFGRSKQMLRKEDYAPGIKVHHFGLRSIDFLTRSRIERISKLQPRGENLMLNLEITRYESILADFGLTLNLDFGR